MSRKQEIYTEMLLFAIPLIRNIQTWPWYRRLPTGHLCYCEAELVHNLQYSILTPEFVEHDIHFLNYQARSYCKNCKVSPNYRWHIQRIQELFSLVPQELKPHLLWLGPAAELPATF